MQSVCAALIGVVVVVVSSYSGPQKPEEKADSREQLDTAIQEAIRLLEAEQYVTLIEKFGSPADLAEMTKEMSLEELATEFGGRKAERLLRALRTAQKTRPVMDADGTKATYKLDGEAAAPESLAFVKVGKYWYIVN